MRWPSSFTSRLTLAWGALLLLFGALVLVLGQQIAVERERESFQRLSRGLARHIVEHWPQITRNDPGAADQAAREALLSMLMVVNPAVQVYVLDADGRVRAYIGEPGMVRQHQVDLAPVRAFLGGAPLPLLGTDPMGSATPRIFSAAMFAPRPGDSRPPGYLYVVLDGQARDQIAEAAGRTGLLAGSGFIIVISLVLTAAIGALLFQQITGPLRRLTQRVQAYCAVEGAVDSPPSRAGSDEVGALGDAFAAMTRRIETQAAREQQQVASHRETMASLAHDLRTPLTALHGHLEALGGVAPLPADRQARLIHAALAQSNKVRRLSQQLFELAALHASGQVLHRERFCLDELVTDAVQKFDLQPEEPSVTLAGDSPGRLEMDGDLHLIERALTNLIDNARRHAPGDSTVRVSLRRDGGEAQIWVEDCGPGLPEELRGRLEQGRSLRDPPVPRKGGGIGGLGLAIAQRVAHLHGGRLMPLSTPTGGTRLCLALPLG